MFSRVSVKSPTLTVTGRGAAALTNEEIIGALAGVPSLASDWVYFHYMNDRSVENKVIGNLYLDAASFAKNEGFRLQADTIYGLVKAAVAEFQQPVCPVCRDSNVEYFKQPGHVCPSCEGTGRRQLSVREICRHAMITNKAFGNNHRAVISYVASVIGEMERQVSNHVRRNLAD